MKPTELAKQIQERVQYKGNGNCACGACNWCVARNDIKQLCEAITKFVTPCGCAAKVQEMREALDAITKLRHPHVCMMKQNDHCACHIGIADRALKGGK